MKEAFGLIKERLEEESKFAISLLNGKTDRYVAGVCDTNKKAIQIVSKVEAEYGNGWIPVEKALPEDCDNRFYMCIVENHEEDLPMFCQYDEDYGFGFWHDYYDEHTLGFVDSEFKTNEELGYEKVIAWQPLPGVYKPEKGAQDGTST